MIEIDTWEKCYPSAWKGIITPESFSHPAKFSSRLIERIYQHGIECGWLHEGSHVIDPFGGVGLGAWPALRYGMDWTGCELEPRFVTLAQANIDAWNAKYAGRLARWGTARIIQGDSRQLAQVIGAAEACISSPPFLGTTSPENGPDANAKIKSAAERLGKGMQDITPLEAGRLMGYGSTPGNLGNMRPSDVDACISSPPYADALSSSQHGIKDNRRAKNPDDIQTAYYGQTPGQLAALPPGVFQAAISSPPFEDSFGGGGDQLGLLSQGNAELQRTDRRKIMHRDGFDYGSSAGQLGNDTGETFWSAAREIVAQVYQVLAPGAHAVWVVKSYVKNKALVDFPHQWQTLCESVGFVTLHEHHALLVRRGATSIDIDGNHHEHKTESKSFFRRLAEKNGSPRIDFETVLCMVKPGGEGGGWDGAISSPPYSGEMNQGSGSGIDWTKGPNGRDFTQERGHRNRMEFDKQDYGQSPGQLGSLPPGSPPDATRHGEGG